MRRVSRRTLLRAGGAAVATTSMLDSIAAADAAPLEVRQSLVRYRRIQNSSRGLTFESADGMSRYWISPDGKNVSRYVPFFLPSSHRFAGWENMRGLTGVDAATMIDEIMTFIDET